MPDGRFQTAGIFTQQPVVHKTNKNKSEVSNTLLIERSGGNEQTGLNCQDVITQAITRYDSVEQKSISAYTKRRGGWATTALNTSGGKALSLTKCITRCIVLFVTKLSIGFRNILLLSEMKRIISSI